jgi:hypothetical protein
MRKIILAIENDNISDEKAIENLSMFIKEGRISEDGYGKQYCWCIRFESKWDKNEYVILNRGNKGKKTESFILRKSN